MLIKPPPFWLMQGDCLDKLQGMAPNTVDAIVTDPPYGLSFMGKRWDYDVPSVEIWAECLRVLKPGGHLLAFAGTRTQHRMAVRIEDAGFEIRDMIAWVYGSGFPKSLDVSKAIDKAAGAEREVVGTKDVGPDMRGGNFKTSEGRMVADITAPATEAARQWQGWGTALKPALEPITVARKPLDGTVAANVLEHGTGALNIDGCRVEGESTRRSNTAEMGYHGGNLASEYQTGSDAGRWPANLIHDGSAEVLANFPANAPSGGSKSNRSAALHGGGFKAEGGTGEILRMPDNGSAARFFYCAKSSKKDRGEGNTHPTVKPADLMAYLCRLVTPPGGVVLDPFMGSGSTGKAAMREGFRFIGIERDLDYFKIAEGRIKNAN